jgi:transposase
MAFREVSVIQVKEVLRRWLHKGEGLRSIAAGAGVDRKTARRYVEAGVALGLERDGGEAQLTEALIGAVCEAVRPARPNGHGASWELLCAHEEDIKGWVKRDLTVAKIGDLLARRGVIVPERTLQRFCAQRCGAGRQNTTVRVADGEPGTELQTDFGRMGLLFDPDTQRRRVVHALIVVAVWSRHMFVWLTFGQKTDDVIAGLEAAWAFFGGVFPILIPDNLSPVVTKADATEPRFNDTFYEYAQDRGILIDAARVRHPKDKPRVERQVPHVRRRFFDGEEFVDLLDAQRRAEQWCRDGAGMRIHGTTRTRPLEAFVANEQGLLLPAPLVPYDVPVFSTPKVHRDHHVEVLRAIYSVPGDLIGQSIVARADRNVVKLYAKGQLVKVHPRQARGGRHTDPDDLPTERTTYALRDIDHLIKMARDHGPSIGAYVEAVLEHPLPWTKMRQAYRLLGLVKKWGADRVELACAKALEAEAINVNLISRMIERATEAEESETPAAPQHNVVQGRFSRDPSEFAVTKEAGK